MISTSLAMRLCGFLYIYILISNAASVGLGNKNNEFDSSIKMPLIAENTGRYRMSVIVAILSHLGIVAIAGMLFLVFNSFNRQLALVGSVFRLGEAFVMIFSEVGVLRLLELSNEYMLSDSNKETLRVIGDQLLQTKNSRVDLGLLFLSIGAIAYCFLFIKNGVVPSRIAWLGFVAGIVSAIGILAKFVSGFSMIAIIGMISMMVFETSFGGWLLFFSKK
jgi:hypothetical protein